jgi:outer membrane murein-binding lipoprotein Lpp
VREGRPHVALPERAVAFGEDGKIRRFGIPAVATTRGEGRYQETTVYQDARVAIGSGGNPLVQVFDGRHVVKTLEKTQRSGDSLTVLVSGGKTIGVPLKMGASVEGGGLESSKLGFAVENLGQHGIFFWNQAKRFAVGTGLLERLERRYFDAGLTAGLSRNRAEILDRTDRAIADALFNMESAGLALSDSTNLGLGGQVMGRSLQAALGAGMRGAGELFGTHSAAAYREAFSKGEFASVLREDVATTAGTLGFAFSMGTGLTLLTMTTGGAGTLVAVGGMLTTGYITSDAVNLGGKATDAVAGLVPAMFGRLGHAAGRRFAGTASAPGRFSKPGLSTVIGSDGVVAPSTSLQRAAMIGRTAAKDGFLNMADQAMGGMGLVDMAVEGRSGRIEGAYHVLLKGFRSKTGVDLLGVRDGTVYFTIKGSDGARSLRADELENISGVAASKGQNVHFVFSDARSLDVLKYRPDLAKFFDRSALLLLKRDAQRQIGVLKVEESELKRVRSEWQAVDRDYQTSISRLERVETGIRGRMAGFEAAKAELRGVFDRHAKGEMTLDETLGQIEKLAGKDVAGIARRELVDHAGGPGGSPADAGGNPKGAGIFARIGQGVKGLLQGTGDGLGREHTPHRRLGPESEGGFGEGKRFEERLSAERSAVGAERSAVGAERSAVGALTKKISRLESKLDEVEQELTQLRSGQRTAREGAAEAGRRVDAIGKGIDELLGHTRFLESQLQNVPVDAVLRITPVFQKGYDSVPLIRAYRGAMGQPLPANAELPGTARIRQQGLNFWTEASVSEVAARASLFAIKNLTVRYGNYGGPGWTGRNYSLKPVDSMDRLFKSHDLRFHMRDYAIGNAELLGALRNLSWRPWRWGEAPNSPIRMTEAVLFKVLAQTYFTLVASDVE